MSNNFCMLISLHREDRNFCKKRLVATVIKFKLFYIANTDVKMKSYVSSAIHEEFAWQHPAREGITLFVEQAVPRVCFCICLFMAMKSLRMHLKVISARGNLANIIIEMTTPRA